ncbi:MAG: glycosyltransferase family 2 protein [Bacteroidales bacterium]|nr:glycosyltransferase family 2 protein [Bacteroidales bacterium]
MVSVVIPLYNKASTIERAILSVLHQDTLPLEIVVIDDGSTDDGAQRVLQIPPSSVSIRLIAQTNQGVSAARNRGIAESLGDWIAFLDADDEWHPAFLSMIIHLRRQYPSCTVAATAYQHIDQRGTQQSITLQRLPFEGDEGLLDNYFEVAAHSHPPFCSISVAARKDSLLAVGGFPRGIIAGEDLLTWARLAMQGTIAYSRKPLATFFPERATYYSRPSRIPQEGDPVGTALERMLHESPSTPGLKAYIAHWHKMRASIYLRLPHYERPCREEIRKALVFDPSLRRKMRLYQVLSFLPYRLRMKAFENLS